MYLQVLSSLPARQPVEQSQLKTSDEMFERNCQLLKLPSMDCFTCLQAALA